MPADTSPIQALEALLETLDDKTREMQRHERALAALRAERADIVAAIGPLLRTAPEERVKRAVGRMAAAEGRLEGSRARVGTTRQTKAALRFLVSVRCAPSVPVFAGVEAWPRYAGDARLDLMDV